MIKNYVPFLAFLGLLFLTLPLVKDSMYADVQGWYTLLDTPIFPWRLFAPIGYIFLIIGNWLLSNKTDKVNWILFALNLFLTFSAVVYLKYPTIFLDYRSSNQTDLIKSIELRLEFIPVVVSMFILGQILLVISFIRTISKTKLAKA
jgi:hypothetical protein